MSTSKNTENARKLKEILEEQQNITEDRIDLLKRESELNKKLDHIDTISKKISRENEQMLMKIVGPKVANKLYNENRTLLPKILEKRNKELDDSISEIKKRTEELRQRRLQLQQQLPPITARRGGRRKRQRKTRKQKKN